MKTIITLLILLPQIAFANIEHVLFIGIDGYGSYNRKPVLNYPTAKTPHIDFIQNNGAWTNRAKIDLRAFSGPNWMGMLTGSPSNVHGVKTNDCENGYGIPTIFDHLRLERPELEMGAIYNWDKIGCYSRVNSLNKSHLTKSDTETADEAVKYIKERTPNFLFVYFGDVDSLGHAHKGNSKEYNKAVEIVDQGIGKILQALKDKNILDKTFIVLTADHGHMRTIKGHSANFYPVPFYMMGPGVKKGKIKYNIFSGQVKNRMVAPLISTIFGVKPLVQWYTGISPLRRYLNL